MKNHKAAFLAAATMTFGGGAFGSGTLSSTRASADTKETPPPAPETSDDTPNSVGVQYRTGCELLPLKDCEGKHALYEVKAENGSGSVNVFGLEMGSEKASKSDTLSLTTLLGTASATVHGYIETKDIKVIYDRHVHISDSTMLKFGAKGGWVMGAGEASGEANVHFSGIDFGSVKIPDIVVEWEKSLERRRDIFFGGVTVAGAFDQAVNPYMRLTVNPHAEAGSTGVKFGAGLGVVMGTSPLEGSTANPDAYLNKPLAPVRGHAVSFGVYPEVIAFDPAQRAATRMADKVVRGIDDAISPYTLGAEINGLKPQITREQILNYVGVQSSALRASFRVGVGGHVSRNTTYALGANVSLGDKGSNTQYSAMLTHSF